MWLRGELQQSTNGCVESGYFGHGALGLKVAVFGVSKRIGRVLLALWRRMVPLRSIVLRTLSSWIVTIGRIGFALFPPWSFFLGFVLSFQESKIVGSGQEPESRQADGGHCHVGLLDARKVSFCL